MNELMLFPLNSVVLPEGKMRLRIFEARYKRLVSEALKADGTFGICLLEPQASLARSELSHLGTLVKIVDFEQLEDGLLGITVAGINRFKIAGVRVEHDGLRFAKVKTLPEWDVTELDSVSMPLSLHLQTIYQQFPQLSELYQQKFFDDASWVSQRWLEILPLSNSEFDVLAGGNSCLAAVEFLNQRLKIDADSDPVAKL